RRRAPRGRESPSWRALRPRRPRPRGRVRDTQAKHRAGTRRCGARSAGTPRNPRADRCSTTGAIVREHFRVWDYWGLLVQITRLYPGRAPGVAVRLRLERVVQGLELRGLVAERARVEPIGEPHVLRQQRAVQVGTEG